MANAIQYRQVQGDPLWTKQHKIPIQIEQPDNTTNEKGLHLMRSLTFQTILARLLPRQIVDQLGIVKNTSSEFPALAMQPLYKTLAH